MQILQHGDTGGMACGLSSAGSKSQIRRFFIGKSTSPRKRITQLQKITSLVNIISFGQSEAKCAVGICIKLEQQGIPIELWCVKLTENYECTARPGTGKLNSALRGG